MSDRDIERQIRNKELLIERLEAEIREVKGYIGGLRRRLSGKGEARSFKTTPDVRPANSR